MKVNLIIPSFYPAVVYGGPIFATLHAAEALSNKGISVYVSTTNANGNEKLKITPNKFLKHKENLYIKYYNETVINRFSFDMLKGLWRDIKDADVVHVQSIFSLPSPMGLFYSKVFKKKVLLSPRGSLCEWCFNEKTMFKKLWLKFLINPFVKNVKWHATSTKEKKDIKSIFPNAEVVVIPDGVNIKEFSNPKILSPKEFMQKFAKVNLSPDKIIVSMGRIHKVKGFDILIKSFKEILKKYPNAVLLIAGKDDGELENLKKLIKKLNIEDKVFFPGPLYKENKRDFLANADVFALPSHTENFGIVYVESLAAGTPIIASKNTPWEEVEQYNCGKWVENSVEETLKAIMEILKKDKNELKKKSIEFAKKYDWDNIAEEFKKIFKEMMNE